MYSNHTFFLFRKRQLRFFTWWDCAYIPDPKPFLLTSKGINKWQIRATGRTEQNSLGRRKQMVSDFSPSRKPRSKPLLLSTRIWTNSPVSLLSLLQSSSETRWQEYYKTKPHKFSTMAILWGCVYSWLLRSQICSVFPQTFIFLFKQWCYYRSPLSHFLNF